MLFPFKHHRSGMILEAPREEFCFLPTSYVYEIIILRVVVSSVGHMNEWFNFVIKSLIQISGFWHVENLFTGLHPYKPKDTENSADNWQTTQPSDDLGPRHLAISDNPPTIASQMPQSYHAKVRVSPSHLDSLTTPPAEVSY